jgi:hypothetical protein
MNKYNKEKEKGENCMLASKPISEYRCASCENLITDLKNNTQYLPWNKFPVQDMLIKPYRIGNGFSHFLQNINLEKSSKNLSEKSDGENNDNQKNNNVNINYSTFDKINNNKNNLPLVNNNKSNIVEIKAHFKNDDNSSINNNNYVQSINTYFTKTLYNDKTTFGKKNNLIMKRNNKKSNIYSTFSNNTAGNIKTFHEDKNGKNRIKYLNIKDINFSKDNKESPISSSRKHKKGSLKLMYNNLK